MQVFEFNLKKLSSFIEQTAKYQKVMLVFDDCVTNAQILQVYEAVKSTCIFNKCYFKEVDEQIYNGYKTIIFMCGANAFLSLNLSLEEFNCAFISMDNSLTCFLKYNNNKNVLFLNSGMDISAVTTVLFNKLIVYLSELAIGQNASFNLPELNSVTQQGILNFFNAANVNSFVDLEILKQQNIDYQYLPIIDHILIDALNMLLNNFLNNSMQYVDFYKSIKDDAQLIDKFYSLSCNNTLKIAMEYNCSNIKLAFSEIYFNLNKINYCFLKINNKKLAEILKKLKNYTKNCTNLLANLYLHNLFGI